MKYYISIHDVKPTNINKIENIIEVLANEFYINKICVLVIPGLQWEHHHIKKLKLWQNNGIEIAAHGWKHVASKKQTIFHKIHSLIISRNSAEHLSKSKEDVITLINNSYNWFLDNSFKKPLLYVPPAWALGNLKKDDLKKLNFKFFECTTGMIYNEKYYFIPLIGFEENTYLGSMIRKFFNLFNYTLANYIGIIRITIHPNDFKLYLKKDIKKYLIKNTKTILLHDLV